MNSSHHIWYHISISLNHLITTDSTYTILSTFSIHCFVQMILLFIQSIIYDLIGSDNDMFYWFHWYSTSFHYYPTQYSTVNTRILNLHDKTDPTSSFYHSPYTIIHRWSILYHYLLDSIIHTSWFIYGTMPSWSSHRLDHILSISVSIYSSYRNIHLIIILIELH